MWRQILGGTGAVAALTSAVAITLNSNRNNVENEEKSIISTTTTTKETKNVSNQKNQLLLNEAIAKSRIWIQRAKQTSGAPGVVIAVSVNGETVWEEGFGLSDVENEVPCVPETVMRIASISKCITMSLVARCWEEGILDLDKPVHEYVTGFPQKMYEGRKVNITSRHLASHRSGIRHYVIDENDKTKVVDPLIFYNKKYENVAEALKLFQDEPLAFEPGTKYLYTTHGYTLLSAVVEEVSKAPFATLAIKLFKSLGMKNTFLDINEKIIYHRSKYYIKNKLGALVNAPSVDNSYKWAGGGFLSTVGDLVRFGNIMLYASQYETSSTAADSVLQNVCKKCPTGFLKRDTVKSMWSPYGGETTEKDGSFYGLGWFIVRTEPQHGFCEDQRRFINHTGGAMGATSNLVIMLPKDEEQRLSDTCLPNGVVVAIITNLQQVPLKELALNVAREFEKIS